MDADDIERGLSLFLVGIYFYVVFSSLIAVIGWELQMAWILMMRLPPCYVRGENWGHYYAVQFKEGEMHGIGTHIRKDGYGYHGEFKDGKQNGHGVAMLPGGRLYVGKWKDGEPVYEEGLKEWDVSYMVRKGSLTFHYGNFWSYVDMIRCAIKS
jgi:hypothetical protein